jgi:hypothetical protein
MPITTMTIKRPNGSIETKDISDNFSQGLTDGMFETIKQALDAGKGECLSYKVMDDKLTAEEIAEIKAHDDKCRWFAKHGFNGNDIN